MDHSEFIERHHTRKTPAKEHKARRRLTLAAGFAILSLYILLVIFITQITSVDHKTIIISALVFLTATLLTVIARRTQHLQIKQEKELTLLKEVLEGSRGGRLVIDESDKTLYFNQRLADMLPTPEISYAQLQNMFSENEKSKALFKSLLDKAHRSLTASIELYCAKKDYEGWYQIMAQPVPGHKGFIHWRVDNVTRRHDDNREVREEREKLIDFTDNAPVGFFSVNKSGHFVFANATFARWLGVDLNNILGKATLHTYLVTPPENARPYDLTDEGGETQIVEMEIKGATGRTFLASISQTIVTAADGDVRTRAIVHDVTAEQQMRRALKESEDRFKKFYDEAPMGIILVSQDGLIEECNAEFARMIGKKPPDLQDKHFKLLICDEDRDKVLTALKSQQDAIESMEISLIGKQPVSAQLHARRFSDGKSTVFHFIDITEKKSLEQQFVQSQKMQAVGQLAGGIAHDFNNLLTAIIGFCDLLLLRHKPGDPSFGDIMQVKQNSNRAANLVRQLLAFSRQQTLRQRVHDITDILTELSHLLRRLIGASVELEMIHGSDLALIKVDEGQMEQVLINLAVNARDAMNGNGKLKITTENYTNKKPIKVMEEEMPAGHWVLIEVSDTGCGISKENISRILEPFFTTKDVGQGTGLGLATVYGIVRQSGGFLDINSKLGEGTTFKIYLPKSNEIDEEEEEKTVEHAETKDLTGSECILLVEDEDAVRTFSQRALSNKGYEVLTAENGDSALHIFEKHKDKKIDLLITDVVMPGMDGPTLAQRIRQKSPKLKIIFMSGYTEDKLKDYMGENIWFLPKPFTLKVLAAKVKEVLEE